MDCVNNTLVVLPHWMDFSKYERIRKLYRTRQWRIIRVGAVMTGSRYDRILMLTEERMSDFEGAQVYDYKYAVLETMLRPGGRMFEVLWDDREPGTFRYVVSRRP